MKHYRGMRGALLLLVALLTGPRTFPGALRAADALPSSSQPKGKGLSHDHFGGLLVAAAAPTPFFRLEKIASRWIFVTPEGHPFWMRSVYAVDWTDGGAVAQTAFKEKYGGDGFAFAVHAVRRLKSWGFNTLGEYSSTYALPVPTYFRPHGNPEKMPFIRFLDLSWYATIDKWHLAPAPVKTLLAGAVDPKIYQGWAGHVPDVFDPNFHIYARNLAADLKTGQRDTLFTARTTTGGLPQQSLAGSPWLIGTTPDDSDDLFGFGPEPGHPGTDGAVHPNLGWIIAVTKPYQRENTEVGIAFGDRQTVRYSDPVVYAKKAWRDFLQKKYGTIQSLNLAWGAHYSTFDSAGGWPDGDGLMDESGRNSWIGSDPDGLSNTAPRVRDDMNQFLGLFAEQYFRIAADAIRAAAPHHLVFSPAVLDSHGGLTRRPILEAAGRYCDAIQVGLSPGETNLIAETYEETHRPLVMWMGSEANADSALHGSPQGVLGVKNQQERAARYSKDVMALFSYKTPDGTYPIAGLDWWEYMDKWSEKANWGLVTPRDNAYDGREDVAARGKDSWGVATGGENGNYGDFLDGVRQTNSRVDERLVESWAGAQPAARGRSKTSLEFR